MFRKFIATLIFIFIAFVSTNVAVADTSETKPQIQPLKIEQNSKKAYKYGNFEKKVKNPNLKDESDSDSFENVLKHSDRKEPSILRIFNALLFVIVLIILTGWVYMKIKKINPEQLLSGKFNRLSENNFKIVSSLQLGAGKAIYLIEINDKQLIVGTTSTNVNLLAQMDKKNDNKDIPNECIEKLFNDKSEEFKKLDE